MPGLSRLCRKGFGLTNRKSGPLHGNTPTGTLISEQGFTLVELLAALLLYGVLLGSLFSLYLFGVNIYQTGATRLDLQQNVRVAADFITRELRYATELQEVKDDQLSYRIPAAAATYTIKHKEGEVVQLISTTETKISYNIEKLQFTWDHDQKILYFSIKGIDNGAQYFMRSAVGLQNLRAR